MQVSFKISILLFSLLQYLPSFSQAGRWQQRVKYSMDINMNVETNILTGKQKLAYTNNSPDTLKKVFYHLYWNAFQPNSMMDNRSRALGQIKANGRTDWDMRVTDRILYLQPNEIGYQKVKWIKLNGVLQPTKLHETILEVQLSTVILPKTTVSFDMEFEAQVPLQVRRSGRDNVEGVKFSMSQWYPKMCEYDEEGWHPTPYVAREFYGVWGDYDVKITIDKKYIIGGTGYLQNANQIGYGYQTTGAKVSQPAGNTLTWVFTAPNVHDFVWAADPTYKHLTKTVRDGLVLHALYKIVPDKLTKVFNNLSPIQKQQHQNNVDSFITHYTTEWETVLEKAAQVLPFIDKTFGKYPYKQYSFIQGGDGGMEYPMATLLKGAGNGVVFHEWMHSWYQMILGTNESEYPWMDEGFTSFAENRVSAFFNNNTPLPLYKENTTAENHLNAYQAYFQLAKSGFEEPQTTHADHYNTNYAYTTASYAKGTVFIEQLAYIVGASTRDKILLEYFKQWKFKHPNANDFIQLAEKTSGVKLDWYREFFINTTKTIDYGIDSLWEEAGKTKIRIVNKGKMPMPVDVLITYKDGKKELHYIPLNIMFGLKPNEDNAITRKVYEEWNWTNYAYIIEIDRKINEISIVEIDPSYRLADINRNNNNLELKW